METLQITMGVTVIAKLRRAMFALSLVELLLQAEVKTVVTQKLWEMSSEMMGTQVMLLVAIAPVQAT